MIANNQIYQFALKCNKRSQLYNELYKLQKPANVKWMDDNEALSHFRDKHKNDIGKFTGIQSFVFISSLFLPLIIFALLPSFLISIKAEKLYPLLFIATIFFAIFLPIKLYKSFAAKQNWEEREYLANIDFKEYAKKRDEALSELPKINQEITRVKNELSALENDMRNNCYIHPDYWGVALTLWGYIERGRAITLMDAINQYEHDQQMERIRMDQEEFNSNMEYELYLQTSAMQEQERELRRQSDLLERNNEIAERAAKEAQRWRDLHYFDNY